MLRIPEALRALDDLTRDVGWIHDPRVRSLFRAIDERAIDVEGLDPIGVLARVPQSRLEALASDAVFVARAEQVLAEVRRDREQARWFQQRGDSPLRSVAYFSPEYGLAASVPQYSGGLGILAGDHLKAADDLGVPLVGVGLFYRHGYFRQQLDDSGRQVERFPRLLPATMAMEPVDDLRVSVDLAGVAVHAAVWRVSVDRISLYLLDTEVDGNDGPDQLVTDRLYGGGSEERIRQELLLGIGGYRALGALGIEPDVFHLNEGHAGFLALERIRDVMHRDGLAFDEAVEVVRPSLLFTTHTPVPAGIDRFDRTLIERYLGSWCDDVGRTIDELMELGRGSDDPDDPDEMFNLAAMSLRLAGAACGVSQLHGSVSRRMFAGLWPGIPTDEVPIGAVTNGVHGRTWAGDEMDALLDDTVGPDWPEAGSERWASVLGVSDERLWSVRRAARGRLIDFARLRVRTATERRRGRASAAGWCDAILDPEALTIGFARRFATYKRATLLLRDVDRLRRLVCHPAQPTQLLFAGKAHPADEPGKEYLRAIGALADDPELRDRVVFVEDYDIDAGRMLTQGCDVWLNTPLRPMEACGTSGMKAAMNGALNCSVLDGWWDEWYEPGIGWAIPSSDWVTDPDVRDAAEGEWLYDLLEREIVPLFFARDGDGPPAAWLARVKASLATLGPRVSADRMVRDYVERYYEPLAARRSALVADDQTHARGLASWRTRLRGEWPKVEVLRVDADEHDPALGDTLAVDAAVRIAALDPSDVALEIVHGPVEPDGELRSVTVTRMERDGQDYAHGADVYRWHGVVPCERGGAFGYAVRAVPSHPDLQSWLDLGLVAWAPWPS